MMMPQKFVLQSITSRRFLRSDGRWCDHVIGAWWIDDDALADRRALAVDLSIVVRRLRDDRLGVN